MNLHVELNMCLLYLALEWHCNHVQALYNIQLYVFVFRSPSLPFFLACSERTLAMYGLLNSAN